MTGKDWIIETKEDYEKALARLDECEFMAKMNDDFSLWASEMRRIEMNDDFSLWASEMRRINKRRIELFAQAIEKGLI